MKLDVLKVMKVEKVVEAEVIWPPVAGGRYRTMNGSLVECLSIESSPATGYMKVLEGGHGVSMRAGSKPGSVYFFQVCYGNMVLCPLLSGLIPVSRVPPEADPLPNP
jgi:hypothetical protein